MSGGVQWHSRDFVVEVAAGTGIHCRGEHECCRKAERHGGAGDGHAAIFERLAQHFQDIAGKFGKFIEEENTVMGERNFAGAGNDSASNQAGVRNGVMRRAIRASTDQADSGIEHARHAVNLGGL